MAPQDQLVKHVAGPRSEGENSSDSEYDYGHSGGDFMDDGYFMDDEVTQDDLLEAWGNAEETNDSENEDRANGDYQHAQNQQILPPTTAYSLGGISYAPAQSGPTYKNSKHPKIAIIPGGEQCMLVCRECGEDFTKTTDIAGHTCEYKRAPILQKLRSCRPKEPPPQRSYNRGGTFLGPPIWTQSWEQRINEWERFHENGWQEDYYKMLGLDEFSDED